MITRTRHNRAFTLVEALVTVAIIAVVAGVTLAAILSSREDARRSVCQSNLSQIGKAVQMYAQDFDGELPPYRNTSAGAGCEATGGAALGACDPAALHDAMGPYVSIPGIWFCPIDPYARRDVDRWGVNHLFASYAFFPSRHIAPGEAPTAVRAQGRHPLLLDDYAIAADPALADPGRPAPSHACGRNQVYLDGHVDCRRSGR